MGDALSALRELRRLIVRLSVISHAPIQGYNFAPSEVGRGQRWRTSASKPPIPHLGSHHNATADTAVPRGGIDHKGDHTHEYRQKSAEYFQRRLTDVESPEELEALLAEAKETLKDWQRTPAVRGVEFPRGSFWWKCEIADADMSASVAANHYAVSARTVKRYRVAYRGVRTLAGSDKVCHEPQIGGLRPEVAYRIARQDGRYVIGWREDGGYRSRTFATRDDAERFLIGGPSGV